MPQFTRRKFLEVLVVSASATALAGCPFDDDDDKKENRVAPEYFPQSVASGDPTATSVVLWTRVNGGSGNASVKLQVASDSGFSTLLVDEVFTAKASNDHCLKIRVVDLSPDTTYYYRFIYLRDNDQLRSRDGRTKTAPAADSTRTVKFAFVSCQDYIGRYYNPYLKLLDQDLDFVVHLGDYVYETTGDPAFQQSDSPRKVVFSDAAGALTIGSGDEAYQSANSLSNYRDLYKTYRSDPILQQIHERFPFVCIWDDHEFSDDSWGATATSFNGRRDEQSETRKRNAEQAWFEFMPVDRQGGDAAGEVEVDTAALYPNIQMYRDFRFGANVHLVMTDFRSYRPDHLIPEEAFPGEVVLDRATLTAFLAGQGINYDDVKSRFSPYVNLDDAPWNNYRPALIAALGAAYVAEGMSAFEAETKARAVTRGNVAVMVINSVLSNFNDAVPANFQVPLIDNATAATLDTGLAYVTMGKTALYGELGSRYFVVKDSFDLYAAYRYLMESSQTQNAYGNAQTLWLQNTLLGSTARWKVLGSSVSYTSLVLDLTNPALGVPAPFNQRFYLNVDHWDGFPQQQQGLLQMMRNNPGTVIIAGDIHSSYAADHGGGVVGFTGTSVSSGSFRELLRRSAASDPTLSQVPGIQQLIESVDVLMRAANAQIQYARSNSHGVSIVEASSDEMLVSYFELDEDTATVNNYANAASVLADMVETRFRVNSSNQLEVL